MKRQVALAEIDNLVEEGHAVLETAHNVEIMTVVDGTMVNTWRANVVSILGKFLEPDDGNMVEIKKMKQNSYKQAETCMGILLNVKSQIEKGIISLEEDTELVENIKEILDRLFVRFHKVAKQLTKRYSSRHTLVINDEYDVQDLLHALLRIYFDDIRAEEWTPSYAGGSSRVDFLLKNEELVIEVKIASSKLKDVKIGEQLIIDIAKYKAHPDCKKLVCFVYDPDGCVNNPIGLINDIENGNDGFVKVYIEPQA